AVAVDVLLPAPLAVDVERGQPALRVDIAAEHDPLVAGPAGDHGEHLGGARGLERGLVGEHAAGADLGEPSASVEAGPDGAGQQARVVVDDPGPDRADVVEGRARLAVGRDEAGPAPGLR